MRWELRQVDEHLVQELSERLGVNKFVAKLLVLRGIKTEEDAKRFLNPTRQTLRSPFLLKDMEKAVEILLRARDNGEKVIIHGDYDVDGITGTAVLYTFLSENGWNVDYYIPKRVDNGYGIQPQFVEEIVLKGFKTILTVDCGITAFEAVDKAKELGLNIVITDHHQPKETLPNADAIVNPKRPDDEYPFKEFAGVGVAYKLITALAEKMNIPPSVTDELLDLVALGTVADMVELLDENRYIVREGLKRLNNTAKLGIVRLIQKIGIATISTRDIGYRIAPKLNAAGRLDSPDDAFKLIVTKDEASATELVEILLGYNVTRQGIEAKIYNEAVQMIESNNLDSLPIVVAYGYGWHLGVIGIVATRLVHLYNKPVMVISIEDGVGRGSARSVQGVNIIELLERFRDIFEDFGGHTMALGFSLKEEKIPELIKAIREKIREEDIKVEEVIAVDEKISVDEINEDLLKSIELLEPYGHGNPEPVFLIQNSPVERFKIFGETGYNIRLTLKGNSNSIEGVGFGLKFSPNEMYGIQPQFIRMDVVGNLRTGEAGPQLNVLDLKFYHISDDDVMDRAFLHSFSVNWKQQKEEEYSQKHIEDDIFSRIEKVSNLYKIQRPAVIRFKMHYRNAFLYDLMRKGRVLIINPSSIEAMHIYESLQRHNIQGLALLNSVNRGNGRHIVTNAVYADNFISNLDDFDFIVLNEIHFLRNFDEELFERIIYKFGKQAFYTTIFNFETNLPIYEVEGKSEFSIEDKRNQPKSLNNTVSSLVYLFSTHNSVEIFFNNYVKKMSARDTVFYSSQLAPFQRLIISNLVKKRKIKRLISSTNTDGLPGLFGKVEVRLFDFPYTLSEIIDAVSGDGNVLLQLNYSTQDVNKRYESLKKLFPPLENLEKIVEELNIYLPMKQDDFEAILSNYDIPKGVVKSIYKDLGGIVENIVKPVDFIPEKITRLKEREIELPYFERYTLQLEALSMKEIYRLIEERYMHDSELKIYFKD
ncbi:single-stranded-DNA-specific exonuclease RecJ [Fervidobacterium sp. 2310opik-2]|uniref:single-stranded-DNA-specific exonuclease RecJ n=1 Tax=Fervidobacterium sp. 2310opik-2 TaxID=1755815 RepID=UPI0013DFD080|nr:single-stranded-DNA-specific exonuclease RecJ [Fervidobacterium sp. 2310opik-2]KAF2961510.1 single-stranded-DNA-specific exonuclease RecJ [Fervidobacterium sp. 2310opik-2]